MERPARNTSCVTARSFFHFVMPSGKGASKKAAFRFRQGGTLPLEFGSSSAFALLVVLVVLDRVHDLFLFFFALVGTGDRMGSVVTAIETDEAIRELFNFHSPARVKSVSWRGKKKSERKIYGEAAQTWRPNRTAPNLAHLIWSLSL